ncbi:MFS gliotoxin efflux transporter glia [Mytilinidion resinicola]|uniref:MFS gliotoxin efflux transporter glia n=1 Tax=Mytilinidion resinicola TaxID=574789 RepID=A0A6A6YYP6_9PEZI|nr:MFS gliotoxin efflux transporter glia [Mytilinidion resinicola]KAF2813563.1 MFS gliotoxin efflux transporter glia [Mytilinidion resinicola]
MSAQSSDFESKRAETEASDPTSLTTNGEHSATDSIREKQDDAVTLPASDRAGPEPEYATGLRLVLIMVTIFMSTFLISLEIGIIATAIPGITDDFHRLDDAGWYGSATFILAGSASPMWGKAYKYLNVKFVYLTSVALFLIGSVVAAAAPNSVSVIIGRALQGFGASGTLSGSVLVINYVAQPKRRPVLIGSWMGVFMTSTILGPLIGGAFTSGVSWRWCFWINLPLGGPIVVLLVLFLKVPKHIKPVPATWKEIILQLDLPGFGLLLASLICFTLALQRGGQTKAWNEGSVIATLVLWVSLLIVFFIVEWLQGARAMIPLRLLKPRVVWSNALYCYISNVADFQVIFYLPIYFQSIHGQSAITSGVNSLPFLAFFALGAMVSGAVIGKTGFLQPYQLISALLMVAGTALLYTMDVDSSKARYIGPQVLFGFGLGLGNQIPMTAVQGFSKPEDVANSTGVMLMCQSISGAYFIAVAQSLFANRMLRALANTAPNINAITVINTGASEIQHVFKGGDLAAVRGAYMVGIKDVFAFSLAGSAVTVLISLVIPFRKLPSHESKKTEEKVATV